MLSDHIEERELPRDLEGKRVTVFGAGVSGTSLARLAKALGADVFVSDSGAIPDGSKAIFAELGIGHEEHVHSDAAFEGDIALMSSGFPPRSEAVRRIEASEMKICGELDMVAPYLRGRVIGVTGTNGKTTTASLIGHLLSSCGAKTGTGGNIGAPAGDFAGIDDEFIVLELSSFQLHWSGSLRLDCAVLTNVEPDHIDWHGSYEAYRSDKFKIFSLLKEDGVGIAQLSESEHSRHGAGGRLYLTWDDDARRSDLIVLDQQRRAAVMAGTIDIDLSRSDLQGKHNMENAAMAVAAVRSLLPNGEAPERYLGTFVPPPHRCALVLNARGIRYIDDSKGTNVAASCTAMRSIEGRKVMILGGRGKGEDYTPLAEALKEHARHAVIIGEERDRIAEQLSRSGYTAFTMADDMESAVKAASAHAAAGDAVILSPACTSWDMYKNYGERGDHFASIVKREFEKRCVTR